MPEAYITLEDAAALESVKYKTLAQRIQRSPAAYSTKTQPREGGGKEQVMIAVSCLSAKARKAHRAAQKIDGGAPAIDRRAKEPPWYVGADLNQYIHNNQKAYYEAVELARQVQDFIEYSDAERTRYADRFALELGISQRTLYRYTENILEATAWALRLEREDGKGRDYFKALSLCRKPRDKGDFPSLTDEQKAFVQNVWFDKDFANNKGTMQMLYEDLEKRAVQQGWEAYPSYQTVARYISCLMDQRGAESARYLAANGLREWKNAKQLKCKRDATTLEVMEYVVADAHTFDLWVSYRAPNGKVKAIRPVVVAWEEMKSRCILGAVVCEHSNAQVVKESVVKMVYSPLGGVPKYMHTDNGKDFTAKENLGQDRSKRAMEPVAMDSETKGFFRSLGAQEWDRSLPYQPWDKPIERAFNTFCLKHSRRYKSYVGTLTASRTEAKRKKDIQGMLERGELLTLEEFYESFQTFLDTVYHVKPHRGLKDAGEKWITPLEVFQNAPRYEKAAPPREYAAMLLMKADTALVRSQGITKFKTLYSAYELCHYVDQKVGVKWDLDDVTKLYVYDKNGKKICEAVAQELLEFGGRVSQTALEELHRNKNRQLADTRDIWNDFVTPYEQRVEAGRAPCVAGKLDLMIGHAPRPKVIALPQDKEYRGEMAAKRQAPKKHTDDKFFDKKADDALARLRAINE